MVDTTLSPYPQLVAVLVLVGVASASPLAQHLPAPTPAPGHGCRTVYEEVCTTTVPTHCDPVKVGADTDIFIIVRKYLQTQEVCVPVVESRCDTVEEEQCVTVEQQQCSTLDMEVAGDTVDTNH